tara:strand:- start:14430 stop:15542 length:1113 start_codon:yes stop_codon:yes gene_type:complete
MFFAEDLFLKLKKNKINFFSGVPDSILKNFCSLLDFKKKNSFKHYISANEGTAVSNGIGYYLSTKKIPCIYLQNSGLSNAINPLISIAGDKVYSIPLFLLIGWRGSPNSKDEPQHMAKGKITEKILKLLNISYIKLKNEKDLKKIDALLKKAKKYKKIVACLIEKNVIKQKFSIIKKKEKNKFTREVFLEKFLKFLPKTSKVISTTGYTSRELYQMRNKLKNNQGQDFYMVGGMGHASSVSFGFAISKSKKKVICLDGDGSLIMHLGGLLNIGVKKPKNLIHILLNNNSHESVGGQNSNANHINFKSLVKSLGYRKYYKIKETSKIISTIKSVLKNSGPIFLEVFISQGAIKNLGRPNNFKLIKERFIKQ